MVCVWYLLLHAGEGGIKIASLIVGTIGAGVELIDKRGSDCKTLCSVSRIGIAINAIVNPEQGIIQNLEEIVLVVGTSEGRDMINCIRIRIVSRAIVSDISLVTGSRRSGVRIGPYPEQTKQVDDIRLGAANVMRPLLLPWPFPLP